MKEERRGRRSLLIAAFCSFSLMVAITAQYQLTNSLSVFRVRQRHQTSSSRSLRGIKDKLSPVPWAHLPIILQQVFQPLSCHPLTTVSPCRWPSLRLAQSHNGLYTRTHVHPPTHVHTHTDTRAHTHTQPQHTFP